MSDSASEPGGGREHQPHRPRITNHDDVQFPLSRSVEAWPYHYLRRSHSTTSLASSLRRFPLGAHAHAHTHVDDDDASSARWGDYQEDQEDHRRRMEDERRVTQILADPQLRSSMLIGSGNNIYQWHKYWTTEPELKSMRTPL